MTMNIVRRPSERSSPEDSPRAQRSASWLTIDHVYVAGAVAVSFIGPLLSAVRPHDFWWHLANGRAIVESRVFPTVDTFTFTQHGEPFFNQMWLAQVILYQLYRAGGLPLVIAAHAAVIGVAYGLLLLLCIRLTRRLRLSALVLLTIVLPLSFNNWSVRPQPYVFPLFVALLWLLVYRPRASTSRAASLSWWSLPALMALWVNLHGSFILGLAVMTVVLLTDVWTAARNRDGADVRLVRRLLTVVLVSSAATVLNPRGIEVFGYAIDLVRHPSVALVSEWQPVTPSDFAGVLYFSVAALAVMLMIYGGSPPLPTQTTVVLALLLLGFTAQRHTVWFALAAAPLLTQRLASMTRPARREPGSPALNGALLFFLVVTVVLASPWIRQRSDLSAVNQLTRETPIAATNYLLGTQGRPRRIFNELGYGSYLAWALPETQTFIDPRFELFPPEQIEDYQALSDGRDVEALIDKYGIDGFLLSRREQPGLISALSDTPRWERVYEDEEAVVFVAQR